MMMMECRELLLCSILLLIIVSVVEGQPPPNANVQANSLTDNGEILKRVTAVTVNFQAQISSTATITAQTYPTENFKVVLRLSDVDMGGMAGVGGDTLGESPVTPTITGITTLSSGILAGGTLTIDGLATITVPDTLCHAVNYLCFEVTPRAASRYVDSDATNDWTCLDKTTEITCDTEPGVDTLTLTSSAYLEKGSTVTFPFDVAFTNNALSAYTDNGIIATTGSDENFQFDYVMSDADIGGTGSDSLSIPLVTATTTLADVQQALAAQASLTISTSVDLTVPDATCTNVDFICVELKGGTGATYVDVDLTNNVKCVDVTSSIICDPDPSVSAAVTETSSNTIVQGTSTTLSLSIPISNVASADTANNVRLATGGNINFQFDVQFSDVDMASGTDTLNLATTTMTPISDVQQALTAGGAAITITGTVAMTLAQADCQNAHYLCVTLNKGTGALYTDVNSGNNIGCVAIDLQKQCDPDPSPSAIAFTNSPAFVQDRTTTAEFNIDIDNVASGTFSDLATAIIPNYNFEITVQMTDVDLGSVGTDTLGLTESTATITPDTDARYGINVGLTITLSGSVDITVPEANCDRVTWACFKVGAASTAVHTDANADNNIICEAVQMSCTPDPALVAPSSVTTGSLLLISGVDVTVDMSLTIENVASVAYGNAIIAVTSPDVNYDISFQLSDADLGSGGTDTLGLSSVVATFGDVTKSRAALSESQSQVVSVSGNVTLPLDTYNCSSAVYVCAILSEGTGTSYGDYDYTNNAFCSDVSSLKECQPAFDDLDTTINVAESATGNIFTTAVTDADGNTVFSFDMTPSGPAVIDINSGVVSVATNFDYETQTVHNFTIFASDSYFNISGILTVNVLDVNEPPVYNGSSNIAMSELDYGTAMDLSLVLHDLDAGDSVATVTFDSTSPATTAGDPFSFDPVTRVLSVEASPGLDYETIPFYELTFTATDTSGLGFTFVVNFTVIDANDPPVMLNVPATVSVYENETASADLYKVVSLDLQGENISYNMTAYPDHNNFYLVSDGENATLYYISNPGFDYETTPEYKLLITPFDANLTGVAQNMTVSILDVNEPPLYWEPSLPIMITILETQGLGQIYKINFTDQDGDTVNFTQSNPNPSNASVMFRTNSDGSIDLLQALDFEVGSMYSYSLLMCDEHGLCANITDVIITVVDVNEPPEWTPQTFTVHYTEEQPANTEVVITATALDPEGMTVTYSISDPTTLNFFSVDPTTGRITSSVQIDRDDPNTPDQFTFDLIATDPAGGSGSLAVTLILDDINDNRPHFTKSTYLFQVQENQAAGTSVGTICANDADSTYGVSQYTAFSTTHFQVSDTFVNGELCSLIRTTQPLDRETVGAILEFGVSAEDPDGNRDAATVRVVVLDVNDNHPYFEQSVINIEVREDAPIGYSAGTLSAIDLDGSSLMSYTETKGLAEFDINYTGGQISVTGPLLKRHMYTMEASGQDDGGNSAGTVTVRIDTYDPEVYLTTVELTLPPGQSLSPEVKTALLDSIKEKCPSPQKCVPKIADIRSEFTSGKVELDIYILKNNNTDSGDLSLKKKFIPKKKVESYIKKVKDSPPAALTSRNIDISSVGTDDNSEQAKRKDLIKFAIALPVLLLVGLLALLTAILLTKFAGQPSWLTTLKANPDPFKTKPPLDKPQKPMRISPEPQAQNHPYGKF